MKLATTAGPIPDMRSKLPADERIVSDYVHSKLCGKLVVSGSDGPEHDGAFLFCPSYASNAQNKKYLKSMLSHAYDS